MKLSIALSLLISTTEVSAFAPNRIIGSKLTTIQPLNVASVPINDASLTDDKKKNSGGGFGPNGAMPDLEGIAFSGMKGKALSLKHDDFPLSRDIRRVIPEDCFVPETKKSLSYLSVSLVGTALCTFIGVKALSVFSPANMLSLPFWSIYSAITGTVAMGLWVLAHECGHGAFSKDKKLQDAVGYALHSFLLVPYYSWQRSHAVHHKYTNHMELGETHVPEPLVNGGSISFKARGMLMNLFGKRVGLNVWGVIQGFLHLVIGWPAYLMFGATGGPARGMTNHFFPNPLTKPDMPNKQLFPGQWKEKVLKSDIGIVATIAGLVGWGMTRGFAEVMALYGGPLLVVNMWLVLYTWLQHTDVDVPHFSEQDHNFVKGALHTIDRPYDKLDPWGAIDFLHHKIGSTHVAHHYDSTIPHYKAQVATDAVKENFPQLYLYDPTPIPQALWRICRGCTVVEKKDEKWIWKNDGIADMI